MPPIIALILCSIFVVLMLWLEHKQSLTMTRSLWIPTIWMLYVASKPLGTWFPRLDADPELGSPLDRAFLIVFICIAFFILIRRKFSWTRTMKENAWLIALVVFMLVSILWSDIPYISFKRWIKEFQAILMAFIVISEPFPRQAMESIFRRTIYILIPFSLFLIKYYPKFGVNYAPWSGAKMWIGVTLHKNRLGQVCLIAVFFLIWSLVRRWQGRNPSVWIYQTHLEIFVLLVALYLVRGPGVYSAAAIAALIIGLLIYLWYSLARKSKRIMGARTVMIIVGAIILIGIGAVFNKGSIVRKFAPVLGRNETLTDRTTVWTSLVPVVIQHPILGKGFGAFWRPQTREFYQMSEGHSGYLDVLLELGFVGMLLISMFLFSSARKAQKILSHDFDWGILWICYLIMALLHNITESSISTLTNYFTGVVLFLSFFSVKHPLVGRESAD